MLRCVSVVIMAACGARVEPPPTFDPPDLSDQPLAGLTAEQLALFDRGDELFDLSLRDADGLGPLFTRSACGQCHDGAARGPGVVQKFGVVMSDGVTPHPDQSRLTYGHTERPNTTAGATTGIIAPRAADVRVTRRVGPPVMGLGYLEAVADETLLQLVAEQSARADGIRGRVNRVTYASEPNPGSAYPAHQKARR